MNPGGRGNNLSQGPKLLACVASGLVTRHFGAILDEGKTKNLGEGEENEHFKKAFESTAGRTKLIYALVFYCVLQNWRSENIDFNVSVKLSNLIGCF